MEAAAAILCREFFRDARPDTARPGKATLCPGDSSLLPMRRGHDLRTIRASWLARLDALRTGVVIIIDVPTYWGPGDELRVLANHAVSQLDENQCQIRLRSFEDGRLRGFGYTETTFEEQAAEHEATARL